MINITAADHRGIALVRVQSPFDFSQVSLVHVFGAVLSSDIKRSHFTRLLWKKQQIPGREDLSNSFQIRGNMVYLFQKSSRRSGPPAAGKATIRQVIFEALPEKLQSEGEYENNHTELKPQEKLEYSHDAEGSAERRRISRGGDRVYISPDPSGNGRKKNSGRDLLPAAVSNRDHGFFPEHFRLENRSELLLLDQ